MAVQVEGQCLTNGWLCPVPDISGYYHLFISHVLTALYYSQLIRAALLMQEPDPWSKYSSRERNVIDTLAETETDTYMLIRSGGGGGQLLDQ